MKTALYDTRHVIKLNPYHGLDEGGQLFSSGGEIDSRTVAAWPLRYSVAPLASVLEFAVRNLGEADTEEGREKALDTIFGRIVNVDLDVDSNYDGEIDDDDEPLEMDPGGLACVGTNNLTRIELKLEPAGLPGKVTLSVEKGGNLIRVWENPNRTDQVTLPKIWNDGAQPGALYIEGVSPSSKAHDVELKLEYDETPQGDNSGLFKCEDRVKLTVVKVEMEFQNSKMSSGKVIDPYTPAADVRVGVIDGDTITFKVKLTPTISLANSHYTWSGAQSGNGPTIAITFPDAHKYVEGLSVLSWPNRIAKITAMEAPPPNQGSWALFHPLSALTASALADEARDWAEANTIILGGGLHNGRADAARHAYWNVLMSVEMNTSIAEGAATAHERTGIENGHPHNETVMDLYNNAVGRSISSGLTTSRTDCQNAVISGLNNGNLWILDNLKNDNEIGLLKPSNQ